MTTPDDLSLTDEQVQAMINAVQLVRDDGGPKVQRILSEYEGIVGAAWRGGAAGSALNKAGDFDGVWKRELDPILETLQNDLRSAAGLLTTQDDDDRSSIEQITAESGGSGMSGNFGSRL